MRVANSAKRLWIHLHRWIFSMAFMIRKQIDGPGEPYIKSAKSETTVLPGNGPDNHQLDYMHMFEAPERTSSQGPHDLSYNSGPSIKDRSPSSDPPSRELYRRKSNRKDNSTTASTQPAPVRPPKQRRTTQTPVAFPGHDLCTLFLSYLETHTDRTFNELGALSHLSTELSLLRTYFEVHNQTLPSAYASPLAAAFLTTCFPAWLRYRTEFVTVKRQLADMHDAQPQLHHHLAVQQRSRLATQLRLAREAFVAAGYRGLRAEQVIVSAVEGVMGLWGQEVRGLRKALRDMEDELGELGEELMRIGGRRWVMGEFLAVGSLEGMGEE